MLPLLLCLLLVASSAAIGLTQKDVVQCVVNKWANFRLLAPPNLRALLAKFPAKQQKLAEPFIDGKTGELVGKVTVEQVNAALDGLPKGLVTPTTFSAINKQLKC